MPKKQIDDIFGKPIAGSTPKKVPTIRQYLRELKKDEPFPVARVDVVWFPGKWNQYSVQTELFRIGIDESDSFFSTLDAFIPHLKSRDQGICIEILDREPLSYRFVESSTYGEWRYLGNAGIKFEATPEA